MEDASSSSPSQDQNPPNNSNPPPQNPKPLQNGHPEKTIKTINNNNKKKKIVKDSPFANVPSASTSSSAASSSSSNLRGPRVPYKRRHPKVLLAAPARRNVCLREGDVEAIALPLGMSFAAVVAQVLERKEAAGETLSADHLSMICTSAVQESLANVFGDKFEFFSRNFEKSFGITLRTLRVINESSGRDASGVSHLNEDNSASDMTASRNAGDTRTSNIKDCQPETDFPTISPLGHVDVLKAEEAEDNVSTENLTQELDSHGQINQLACAPSSLISASNQLSTLERSVIEHSRSNNLKAVEISLTMRRLKLKEAQLALSYDSNHLERSKLAMGVSKATLKAEKFKSQLEDTRHGELLRKVIDCLVAGLFVMSACLSYGAYVFSYKRISEATASCNIIYEDSKSWWIPRPFSSYNSGLHILRCQVQVVSRMLFGMLMILAIAYLLLQRSGSSQQTMPVTFILLLLGVACGFAGKVCVDTLGGGGLHWLFYWEILCLLHFLSNICTPTLFQLLYGPVAVSQGMKSNALFPYWFRRFLYYAMLLVFLPLCSGLLPFARPGEWKDHLVLLASNFLSSGD